MTTQQQGPEFRSRLAVSFHGKSDPIRALEQARVRQGSAYYSQLSAGSNWLRQMGCKLSHRGTWQSSLGLTSLLPSRPGRRPFLTRQGRQEPLTHLEISETTLSALPMQSRSPLLQRPTLLQDCSPANPRPCCRVPQILIANRVHSWPSASAQGATVTILTSSLCQGPV